MRLNTSFSEVKKMTSKYVCLLLDPPWCYYRSVYPWDVFSNALAMSVYQEVSTIHFYIPA